MVMLYRHPSTLRDSSERKGVVIVSGEKYDYIVVEESEVASCAKEGFFKTPKKKRSK
jgi:hypothetical protein